MTAGRRRLGLLALAALLVALAAPGGRARGEEAAAPASPGAHGEAEGAAGHHDPIVPVLFTIVLVLVAGRLGGDLAVRAGQPEVLGELVAGVVLGNLALLGIQRFDYLRDDPALSLLAGLGVILLLFEVGLESTVGDMMKVGASSLLVAVLGVVVPILLGWGVGIWLLPEQSVYAHAFLGATLCATSVGITARVLQDLGRSRDFEARIILGAAVIDDVLGLVILAVIAGIIQAANAGQELSIGGIAWTAGLAIGFLAGAILVGQRVAPRLFEVASYLRARNVLQATALAFCFLLAGLSGWIGLAPIVGAFAAGLLLEDVHFRRFGEQASHELEVGTRPLILWLAPFFFVQMGTRVDLATFARVEVLGLAAAVTVAAVLGKQVCSLGVLERGRNRLAVGIGMIPRGEVGLIFAQIGESLRIGGRPVIDSSVFSAVVIMVILTTVLTPGLLGWSLRRGAPAAPAAAAAE